MRPAPMVQIPLDAEVRATGNQRSIWVGNKGRNAFLNRRWPRKARRRHASEARRRPIESIAQGAGRRGAKRERGVANGTIARTPAKVAGHRERIAGASS